MVILACKSIVLCMCSGNRITGYRNYINNSSFVPMRRKSIQIIDLFHLVGRFLVGLSSESTGLAKIISIISTRSITREMKHHDVT